MLELIAFVAASMVMFSPFLDVLELRRLTKGMLIEETQGNTLLTRWSELSDGISSMPPSAHHGLNSSSCRSATSKHRTNPTD
jgi:hypothetical protein